MPEYEVWAFGSRVTGKVKSYSDLDLAIITDNPLSLARHAELVEAFSESDLTWKVDIVDWALTSENFREIIKQNAILLKCSNSQS
ncbi:DNA polymerase subunit beta [Actinobacillus equuli]|nr:DNA polymerase subunit beta [Actinobacillus equuli]